MSRCRLVVLALALVPGGAEARPAGTGPGDAPVASQRIDVDGDGAPEELRIEREGTLAVRSGRSGSVLAWKPLMTGGAGAARGEIQVARGAAVGGRTVIVAVANAAGAGGRGEALAAEWRGGLHELWRGEVGPQGADGESTLYIEAGRHGLIRYSGRVGVTRCDGATAHLYAEKFDFAGRGRFRPVDDLPRIPGGAPELVATRTPPSGAAASARPIDFRALAASSQAGASGAGDLVAPAEIEDGDAATAWVEGRSGFGRGEFVTARASLDGGMVRAVRLVPGHAANARSFQQHNRLKRIGLLVGRDRAYRVVFAQDPARAGGPGDTYWIALPEPVRADCVSLVVAEVYFGQGGRAGQTAIAELAVLTEMDLAPGGAASALAAAVAAGGRDGEQAVRVLARLGGAAEAALLAEAQRPNATAEALLRLRRALAEIPGGAAELARGLAVPGLHPADAERFARALAAIGRPAVEPLAEILADRSAGDPGRARAAQALGRIADPAALHALAGAAGTGPREIRRAVALAIGHRPASDLDPVLAAAAAAAEESEAREADLWRAVGWIARAQPPGDARRRAAAAIAGRLASADGYELRVRLLEAAGMDEPGLVAALAAELVGGRGAGLRDTGADEPSSAAGDPGPDGEPAGVRGGAPGNPGSGREPAGVRGGAPGNPGLDGQSRGSADGGPDGPGRGTGRRVSLAAARRVALRRVAAAALGRSRSDAATAALARAARDPDPGVREAVAEALGERGAAGGDAALGGQLAGDSWARVRRAAAAALGTACRRPAPAASLRRAALSDRDVQVRRAALSSLMTCGASGAVRFLLAVAANRGAPGQLRTHALRLIGGSGDRSAATPLAALVTAELELAFSDEGAIAVAAAGVYALGQLGDASAAPVVMRAAEAVAFPEIQAAAAGALGRLCLPAGRPVLRDLAASSQHQVSAPARAALRRCR